MNWAKAISNGGHFCCFSGELLTYRSKFRRLAIGNIVDHATDIIENIQTKKGGER